MNTDRRMVTDVGSEERSLAGRPALEGDDLGRLNLREAEVKVGGVVMVVILLHLLIVGGAFLIPGCRGNQGGEARPSILSETEPAAGALPAPAPSAPERTPVAQVPAAARGLVGTAAAAAMEGGRATPAPRPSTRRSGATELPATYTVKKGDTLWGISEQFGISMTALQAANGLSGPTIVEGQVLRLPSAGAAVPAPRPESDRASARSTSSSIAPAPKTPAAGAGTTVAGPVYRVQRGDSLWTIAKAAGITVAELKAANNMTGEMIRVDQELVIPGKAAPAATGTGGGTSSPVAAAAPTASTGTAPAQATATEAGAGATVPAAQGPSAPEPRLHTMREGELLNQVARDYNVTLYDVLEANKLTSREQVKPGMVLIIPPSRNPGLVVP